MFPYDVPRLYDSLGICIDWCEKFVDPLRSSWYIEYGWGAVVYHFKDKQDAIAFKLRFK